MIDLNSVRYLVTGIEIISWPILLLYELALKIWTTRMKMHPNSLKSKICIFGKKGTLLHEIFCIIQEFMIIFSTNRGYRPTDG